MADGIRDAQDAVRDEYIHKLKAEVERLRGDIVKLNNERIEAYRLDEVGKVNAELSIRIDQHNAAEAEIKRLKTTVGICRQVIEDKHAEIERLKAESTTIHRIAASHNQRMCDLEDVADAAKDVAAATFGTQQQMQAIDRLCDALEKCE